MTPKHRCALAVAAALLVGCDEPTLPPPNTPPPVAPPTLTPPPPPAFSPPPPTFTPPPPPAVVDPRSQIDLPTSTTRLPVPTGLPVVLISRQAIVVQGDQASFVPLPAGRAMMGVEAIYKRSGPNDLFIVPLASALARSPIRGSAAAVGADASTPYRVLVEVLYTAVQSQVTTLHLLTRTASGFGAIELRAPRREDPQVEAASLSLSVVLAREGLTVKTTAGNMATGCFAPGPGVTIPRGPGDLSALQACAASLRKADPRFAQETQATLSASPDVTFAELVAVMDALRTEPSGATGFPDIAFGIMK